MKIQVAGGREVNVAEPKRGNFASGLGGALEYSLCHFIYKLLEIMGNALGVFVGSTLVSFLEIVEPEMVEYVSPLLDLILAEPSLDPKVRKFFEGIRHPEGQAAAAILGGIGSAAGGAVVGSILGVVTAPITYRLAQALRPARTGPAEAWAMYWRGAIDHATLRVWLADTGWPVPAIDGFRDVLRPRLSEGELIGLSYRQQRNPERFRAELKLRGWQDAEINKMFTMSHRIPDVTDLVRMAVREAWRDDIAAKWGYDQDYVPQFGEWMEKQGMSEEWAKKYWRAHWELPSLTMAREMVHRTDFTVGDFKDLLRTADIPAGYRNYIAEIIFSPFTRVDIRRMYRVGTLKEADLVRSYMDIGYKRDKAVALTDFTIREYGETEREATKADVISAYTDELISRSTARDHLTTLEYPSWLIGWYLDRADLAKAKTLVTETVRYVKTMYINYQLNKAGVHAELGKLNFPASRINRLLTEWDITRLAKVARPSVSKLEGYFLNDIITQTRFVSEMGYHKYASGYITWAVKDILRRKKEAADKEEERVRKEQERLEASELRTDRDLDLAKIGIKIAQAQSAIADIQIALLGELDHEAITAIEVSIAQAQDRIAGINVKIAQHRAAITDIQLEPIEAIAPERVAELREIIATHREDIAGKDVSIAELYSNIADIMVVLAGELTPEEQLTYQQAILLYQSEIADIEVEIAEIREDIASLQLDLVSELTPELVSEIQAEIAEYRDRIADLQVNIAKERDTITTLRVSLVKELSGLEAVELRTSIAEYRALIASLNLEKARIRKAYYQDIAEV